MTITNITDNRIINAAGRLIDPGKTILMEVSYYAQHKSFVDQYVKEGKAKIDGLDEYEAFLKSGKEEEQKDEPTDLLAEVQAEAEEKQEVETESEEKPAVEEEQEAEAEAEEKPKTTRRRRSRDK